MLTPLGGQVAGRRRGRATGARGTGCWRRCASTRSEKLSESGEADVRFVRAIVTTTPSMAVALDASCATAGYRQLLEQAETEIDNLRAAFAWSREGADIDTAMRIAVSLSPALARKREDPRRTGMARHRVCS